MTATTTLFKEAKSQDPLTDNQDLFDSNNSNAKYHEAFSMYPYEAINKREQEYYDKASGCSVKAQENNIHDYQAYIKN
jgi:hypothetical protein